MLGRLLKRFFGGRDAARPVSPPPPPVPRSASAPAPTSAPTAVPITTAPVPPPPPPPVQSSPEPLAEAPLAQSPLGEAEPASSDPSDAAVASSSRTITDPGRVRFVLEDGSLAEPEIDPEFEERLKYLVDNIVSPKDPPTT